MIAVFVAEGFEEIETIVPVDILRRVGINTKMYGVKSKLVRGGHGMVMECDDSIENLTDDIEGVIVPGGHEGAVNIANSSACKDLIIQLNTKGKMIAAICAAPALVLEPLNILAGKQCTCHPSYQDSISSGKYCNDPVVADGNIITARAAGTALLFAQEVVAYIQSIEAAQKIMQDIYFTTA